MEPIQGDANGPEDSCMLPLLDLPGPCLRAVVLELWPDLQDVAALSCCCTSTAQLCGDQQLWKELLTRRYGNSALPGEAAAGMHNAGVAAAHRLCRAAEGHCSCRQLGVQEQFSPSPRAPASGKN